MGDHLSLSPLSSLSLSSLSSYCSVSEYTQRVTHTRTHTKIARESPPFSALPLSASLPCSSAASCVARFGALPIYPGCDDVSVVWCVSVCVCVRARARVCQTKECVYLFEVQPLALLQLRLEVALSKLFSRVLPCSEHTDRDRSGRRQRGSELREEVRPCRNSRPKGGQKGGGGSCGVCVCVGGVSGGGGKGREKSSDPWRVS